MPALESTTIAAVALAAVAAIARIAAERSGTPRLATVAEWTLLAASALALAAVALPRAWTASVLHAPPFQDPRLAGSLAVAIAALLSTLALSPALVRAGMSTVSLVSASAVGAAIAAAAVAFLGLRASLPVIAVALGGASLTPALLAIPRLARAAGRWRQALLVCGAALVAIATTLACCGARAGDLPVAKGAIVDTLGYMLAYQGEREASTGGTAIALVIAKGRWQMTAEPTLPATGAAGVAHEPFGGLFTGPVGILHGVERGGAGQHPVVWLAKGDSVIVGAASLRFVKFRIESGTPVRMYADVAVTRAGKSSTVSPAVHASAQGEQPIPVAVDGVGSILVAGMDADHGRVALLIPGAGERPAPTAAHVTLALRPGLELGWLGLALGIVALLRVPRTKPASA